MTAWAKWWPFSPLLRLEAQSHIILQGDSLSQPQPKNKDMVYVLTARCWFLFVIILRHIAVLVRRGLASLYVLLVDKHFDALLYHADTWVEPRFGLVDHLKRKTRVKIFMT